MRNNIHNTLYNVTILDERTRQKKCINNIQFRSQFNKVVF